MRCVLNFLLRRSLRNLLWLFLFFLRFFNVFCGIPKPLKTQLQFDCILRNNLNKLSLLANYSKCVPLLLSRRQQTLFSTEGKTFTPDYQIGSD